MREVDALCQNITPKFPALISFGITSDIANPLEIGDRFEHSAFYYAPILSAPKLENLQVRTGGYYRGTNDFFHVRELNPDSPSDFDLKLFDRFINLKSLELTMFRLLSQSDINNLFQRCPNLEILKITLADEDYSQQYPCEYDNVYEGIGQLKRLTEVVLQWPDYEDVRFEHPKTLEKWVTGWLKSGMDNLRVVRFDGLRYRRIGRALLPGRLDPVRVLISVHREDATSWRLKVGGDTEDYQSSD